MKQLSILSRRADFAVFIAESHLRATEFTAQFHHACVNISLKSWSECMRIIRHLTPKNRHSVLLVILVAAAAVIWIGAADISSGPSSHIGIVSLQRIGAESTAAQAGAKRLDATREEKRRAIAEKQKQLEAARLQLANAGGIFQASRRAQLRRDEERLRAELPQLTEQSQAEIQNLQRQLQGDFRGQLESVLNEIASRRRIDLVLNSDAAVVWNRGAQDLTAETIKGLNARSASTKDTKDMKDTKEKP